MKVEPICHKMHVIIDKGVRFKDNEHVYDVKKECDECERAWKCIKDG